MSFDHARVISSSDGTSAWFELDVFAHDGVTHERPSDHAARDEAIRRLGMSGYTLVSVTYETDDDSAIRSEHLWFRREVAG